MLVISSFLFFIGRLRNLQSFKRTCFVIVLLIRFLFRYVLVAVAVAVAVVVFLKSLLKF